MPDIIHEMIVSDPWFSHIRSERKPIEGRKMSPRWNKILVGDKILMKNNDKFFMVTVINIVKYGSEFSDPLRSYLHCETLEKCLPGINSIDDGIEIYHQWSTNEEIKEYGMMAIHVSVDKY
jgi:ASC-1-like (ASCH) protein